MIRLKPTEHLERRFRFEPSIELFIVFFLCCALAFVLPVFIAVKAKSVGHSDWFYDFLWFLYSKDGRSYPLILTCGVMGTFIYGILQLNNKKVVEIVIEGHQLTIVSRNTFSGRIRRHVMKKEELVVAKCEGRYAGDYYKLYTEGRFISSFYPNIKPWNQRRDRETIDAIKQLFDNPAL